MRTTFSELFIRLVRGRLQCHVDVSLVPTALLKKAVSGTRLCRRLNCQDPISVIGFSSVIFGSCRRSLAHPLGRPTKQLIANFAYSRSVTRSCLSRHYATIYSQSKGLCSSSNTLTTMNPDWKAPPPCKVGDPVSLVDTPALLIDLDKMQNNLDAMKRLMTAFPGVQVRPHVKAHKCPAIARIQVDNGCNGVCTQTLVESEAMVYGAGIKDVFLTNQLIGGPKLRRFAALAKHAEISICVDDLDNIKEISEIAGEAGVKIGLVVEVNVGQDRCGVERGEPAANLSELVQSHANVYFKGLHCYQGWNQHVREAKDRETAVGKVVDQVKETLEALKAKGIHCSYVTGGGTGTFPYESKSGVYTEVQPGSYVLMDVDYAKNFGEDGKKFQDFKHSMYVLTTVQSVSKGNRVVVDAGMKSMAVDSGVPLVDGKPELTYHWGGDEHGILRPDGGLKVGDMLWLIPGHCDPTVNLYDWLVGFRGDKVETVWPVLGRGPGV